MLVLNEIKTIENIETKISKVIKNVVNYNDYENHKDLLNFIENEAKKYNINLNDVFNKQSDSSRKILEKFKSNNDKRIKNFFKTQHNEIHYHRPLLYPNYCYPCIAGRTFVSNKNKNFA